MSSLQRPPLDEKKASTLATRRIGEGQEGVGKKEAFFLLLFFSSSSSTNGQIVRRMQRTSFFQISFNFSQVVSHLRTWNYGESQTLKKIFPGEIIHLEERIHFSDSPCGAFRIDSLSVGRPDRSWKKALWKNWQEEAAVQTIVGFFSLSQPQFSSPCPTNGLTCFWAKIDISSMQVLLQKAQSPNQKYDGCFLISPLHL